MGLSGSGTFLGPQEALGAFGSLGSSVRLRGLASPSPPHSLSLPLEPPWASLGPWNLPEASGSLGSLQQPWVFSHTQGPCWWLVRVTLVVDWLFAVFCSKILGPWWGPTKAFCGYVNGHWVGLYFQVVGTHKHYMSSSKFFLPLVVGALKPSIILVSLPSLPLAPSHSPHFLLLPSCSPHSLLLPLPPLASCPNRGCGDPKT